MMYTINSTRRSVAMAVCACVILCGIGVSTPRAVTLEDVWESPPPEARPWVFWYWMHAAVSPEGLTADLEAMAQAGIAGAYLIPIKPATEPPLFEPPTHVFSERWWEMLRHTMREAGRLGIEIAMPGCDGFATGGAPFITPDLSMQKVTWSQAHVAGGETFDGELPLPDMLENYYRDIVVLAFPSLPGTGISTHSIPPKVTTTLADAREIGKVPNEGGRIRSIEEGWLQYAFDEPFTCRSITIRAGGRNYQANRLIVEYSNDGENFTSLGRLESPRHGWLDWDVDNTHAIPPTTARFFRFIYDKAGTEPGAEDLDSAKWRNRLQVSHIELSGEPRISLYEGKSAVAWRKSSRTTAAQLPDELCVPLDRIVDLTGRLGEGGRLQWTAPAGKDWTILRIGHTSTGHKNETGGAMKGLEADKLNPAATRLLFDGWFGATMRRLGPELSKGVLTKFHIDSWECGSQNWTPAFIDEFKRLRGYDPTPYLPAYAGIPVVSAEVSERFLHDVRATISDLVITGFYEPLTELAHDYGLEFTGECTAPVMMGDGMRHFGTIDMPMGEFWLRSPTHDKPNDMHDAISAAHIYGKPIVGAEAFTELWLEWDEHPGMLKALGDAQFALGINKFVMHLMTHNPWMDRQPGMTLDHVGLYFQRDQTWWPMAEGYVDYLTRVSAMLQQGRPVARVAYYTGEQLPSRAILPERYEPPLPEGTKADSINRDALLRLATVVDGKIALPGGAQYDLLVLPSGDRMSLEVAQKLAELLSAGAKVYGKRPSHAAGLIADPVRERQLEANLTQLWGWDAAAAQSATMKRAVGDDGRIFWGQPLAEVLAELGRRPDLQVLDRQGLEPDSLLWTHRAIDGGDLYFISNQLDRPYTPRLRLPATDVVIEIWDPVTKNQTQAFVVKRDDTGIEIMPQLAASGSAFVVVRGETGAGKRYYNPTDDQITQRIDGPWSVRFAGLEGERMFRSLEDWSQHADDAIKHFSGVATYRKSFNWTGNKGPNIRVSLALGEVKNLARVVVNGEDCGVVWTAPYQLEITDAVQRGNNTLEIQVANTWANRLIGDLGLTDEERRTTTTAGMRFGNNPELLPAGLLGPVWLITER